MHHHEVITGQCEYLPDRAWRLHYVLVDQLTPDEYMERLRRGWRRFGHTMFRPVCSSCSMCQSLRVPVATFRPDRSQARAWKANVGTISITVGAPSASRANRSLFRKYHRYQHQMKGWSAEVGDYIDMFVRNPFPTEEWRYHLGDRLVGVGYVDRLPDGLSAIHFHYDPHERTRSLGTFNVLSILAAARARQLPHVYLGYYVDGFASYAYKARFRPNEVLHPDGVWRDFGRAC